MHWIEAGRGRPLVLLHGLADSHRTWSRSVTALARHRRVLAIDLPGHGLSERPDASYDLGWHARVVGQWCDYLGLDEFDVAGHSYGGGVAQFMLLSHGHRMRRVALVAPGGLGRGVHPALRLLALPLGTRFMQPFMKLGTGLGVRVVAGRGMGHSERAWLAAANGAPGSARAFVRTTRGVVGLGGQRVHFLDHAKRIDALPPVRLFWGDKDPVVPWRHGVQALDFLQGVRLVRFAGCGHFPHAEAPDLFARELLAFLDDPYAQRATLRGKEKGTAPRRPPTIETIAVRHRRRDGA
ncbi:MAG: alpha/beta fold hydrolase [Myxococcales bacterium]|nr:alpha/beta fold hydrolase [Myxococcales bacterium]